MIAKMKPAAQGGSRLAIVFNGSPLFTGAAGSGESEIRRWIIENDWLDAIVALPDQLFYNTGISTYFWIVTNRKTPERRGTVQLIDARECFVKMRKSLGEKRKQIADDQIDEITRLYADHAEGERVKIFPNEVFGFLRITVERPLRRRWEVTEDTIAALQGSKVYGQVGDDFISDDSETTWATVLDRALAAMRGTSFATAAEMDAALAAAVNDVLDDLDDPWDDPPRSAAGALDITPARARALLDALAVPDPDAEPITDRKGNPEPDPDLRDQENVPLPGDPVTYEADPSGRLATPAYRQAVDEYVAAEVHPYVSDAWVDHAKTKLGYEIPLTRHFYKYVPPRPLDEIDAEIKALEAEIEDLLREVTE